MNRENRHCSICHAKKEFEIYRNTESVVLRGSSHAVLRGSSHAVLWGSSHAELRGSSHAVLRGSSHAELWNSSHAEASKYCSVTLHGKAVKCEGGMQIHIPEFLTAQEWCAFYGVEIKKGVAILYKAVNDDFSTQKGVIYASGTMPKAPDWDGGKNECGGGLHFSFHPVAALEFKNDAKKFVACPVRVSEIVIHKNAQYPTKIKALKVCAPVWKCDRNGKPINKDKREENAK